jgi:RecT family protein
MPSAASTDVVVHGTRLPLTERARDRWDSDSLRLLAASKAQGADIALLYTLAELSARYDLDAWADEIVVVRMRARDGGPARLVIMIPRDGYMKIAKRDRTFIACAGQAVYSNDELEVEINELLELEKFRYRAAHPAKRGEPTGAFAILRREGKPSLYFFAPISQFKRDGGAWKYEDAMLIKCAQSYLLRTTYNVSGPAPIDELMVGFHEGGESTVVSEYQPLPERIAALFERASGIDPLPWRRNEVEARVFGPDGSVLMDEVRRVEAELKAWLAANEPPDAEVASATSADQAVSAAPAGESETFAASDVPEAEQAPADAQEAVERAEAAEWWSRAAEVALGFWRTKPEWRAEVSGKLHRLADLEVEHETRRDGPEDLGMLVEEIDQVEGELERLGVPRGWRPPTDTDTEGQASLGL